MSSKAVLSIPGQASSMLDNDALRQGIQKLACHELGRGWQIASYQPLTNNDLLHVARVSLASSQRASQTLIVKHIHPDHYPARSQDDLPPGLTEEAFIYSFLARLQPPFTRCPRMLAAAPGILLLEDLGDDDRDLPIETVMESVAASLVELHTRTANAYPAYLELRKAAGLGKDRRMYTLSECQSFFQFGVKLLAEYWEKLGLAAGGCQAMLRDVQDSISNPGPFRAFIHDDLAARRQFLMVDGRCCLIDFEMGKYGHILLDVCKPLVGKLQRKRGTDYYYLDHLDFPLAFACGYREQLAAAGGFTVDDDTWHHALSSALIFSTMVNLGALTRVAERFQPLGSFLGIVRQSLERLLLLLDGNESHAVLKPPLGGLAERIVP